MGSERVEEKKGFKVVDKRFFAQQQGEGKPEGEKEEKDTEGAPLPEVTFSSFIYSLSTTCLIHLGEIPEPTTNRTQKNLPLAKQTIDVLGILWEKTRGNLTEEEERLLQSVLTDLRIRYVRAVSS